MFHMNSTFDLRPGVTVQEFEFAWGELVDAMVSNKLIVSASGLLERRRDTPLDTDDDSSRRFFTVMSFRDRAQSEAAWDVIEPRTEPVSTLHVRVTAMVTNAVFTCWEDRDGEHHAGT